MAFGTMSKSIVSAFVLSALISIAAGWQISPKWKRAGTIARHAMSSEQSPGSSLSHSSSIPQPSSSSPMIPQTRRRRQLHKDVVIVGGGLAGLSTALYLTQIDPERRITIVDKNEDSRTAQAGTMASMAAAGMLAPNSERLPKGDYLDLCMASRRMYADFTALVEGMAQESCPEGLDYLPEPETSGLDPWNVGYVASGGFLAPAFAGDSVATWAPPEDDAKKSPTAFWLDATQARELEPHLHPDVVGGWWFPEDASVDARRLTCSLKAACVGAGVEFMCGARNEVTALDLQEGICKGLWLGSESGKYVSAKAVLVANGAWMRNLLPVPLEPHKGQSLSLRMPKDRPPILKRVLFGGDSYIVPKADGRIVIGATVEAGSFDSAVTPSGIMHVLTHALQLVPGLADLPIEETWAGLRPTTPDKGPILGETPWENLFLAGGYWRNGVLLAPKTGELLANLIANQGSENTMSQEDKAMLESFAWDRFTTPEGGKKMAANARYAASMYPVHKRKSGTGIAAAVGTELGSYSTARSAGEERQKDRKSLFGEIGYDGLDDETEDLFEKAAAMGKEDADVFEGFENKDNEAITSAPPSAENSDKLKFYYPKQEAALRPKQEAEPSIPESQVLEVVDGSPDAITVGSKSNATGDESEEPDYLDSIYESIRKNKAKQQVDLPNQDTKDERPDPGFRISHVDSKTGQVREMPPFTNPAIVFTRWEEEEKGETPERMVAPEATVDESAEKEFAEGSGAVDSSKSNDDGYDETTYDGYQAIFKANASNSRKEELEKMKQARIKNRSSAPPRDVKIKE